MSDSKDRLNVILQAEGRDPKRSLGQNFLVNDSVIAKIIAAVEALKFDEMIEVGPGPGSLTYFLRQNEKPLTLIELDQGWAEYWRNQKQKVIEADALQINWQELIKPGVLLVSNLPYQISSSLVIDRCLDPLPLTGMILMFQKEVAQKIRGLPGTDHYGFLSVMAQSFWKIENVTDAGSGDFWPPPKVSSRVLKFVPLEVRTAEPLKYLKFVKTAFQHRRKLLKSNWQSHLDQKKNGWEVVKAELIKMGFKETLRGEEINPAQFQSLYDIWRKLA
jgi:16S rRNA (adenine1518-N6/adenine1519-N6)-dimethyltransferase